MIVDETTSTMMGEIAHIEGVGKRSARHNPNLPEERLNDSANLILWHRSEVSGNEVLAWNSQGGQDTLQFNSPMRNHKRNPAFP